MINKEKIQTVLNKFVFVSLVIGSLIVGYVFGFYSKIIFSSLNKPKFSEHIISNKEVRISLDESTNFIIMNRSNGEYQIYSDTIGKTIFHMYAKQMISQ